MRDLDKQPGNARIALALLEVLGGSADVPRRERAERALGQEGTLRRRRVDWIRTDLLRETFRAVPVDSQLARSIGRRLVEPHRIGLMLCYTGVATPEKAYRRANMLLARERPGDCFEPSSIESGRARIEFRPAVPCESDAVFCQVRAGMLESIPSLYGLLPARVIERKCAHLGAERCVFDVEWQRTSRVGLGIGLALGLSIGAAGALLLPGPLTTGAALPVVAIGVCALAGALVGGAVGRSVDLARQLRAVAHSGLGQLVMLDQMDGVLAEKMDALSKLERVDGGGGSASTPRVISRDAEREEVVEPALLSRFHDALATLQRAMGELHQARQRPDDVGAADLGGSEVNDLIDECIGATHELHSIGGELSQTAERQGSEPESVDLAEIVRRGIAAVRPGQSPNLEITLAIETDPAPIRCHPFQIEQVVIQLLMNAADAMAAGGCIDVALRQIPDGFEVSIADTGEGIDADVLDRLFDPFFAAPAAGAESGLGLTLCYRIVNRHGGELAVQSEPGLGTRVAVILPVDWSGDAPGSSTEG